MNGFFAVNLDFCRCVRFYRLLSYPEGFGKAYDSEKIFSVFMCKHLLLASLVIETGLTMHRDTEIDYPRGEEVPSNSFSPYD